jgi:two-component system, NarL family, response regulator NreC
LLDAIANNIRVFVAEDNPLIRRGMKLLLREVSDIDVQGDAAVEWSMVKDVEVLRPDVVILNSMTGSMDKPFTLFDIVRVLVETVPSTAVVIITANDREEYLVRALKAGVSGFILAHAEVDVVPTAVRSVARGNVFICPAMVAKLAGDFVSRLQRGVVNDPYEQLSGREREVLPLLAPGDTDHEVAETLSISPHTVATYRKRIMKKLNLHSKTAVMKYALQRDLIEIGA